MSIPDDIDLYSEINPVRKTPVDLMRDGLGTNKSTALSAPIKTFLYPVSSMQDELASQERLNTSCAALGIRTMERVRERSVAVTSESASSRQSVLYFSIRVLSARPTAVQRRMEQELSTVSWLDKRR